MRRLQKCLKTKKSGALSLQIQLTKKCAQIKFHNTIQKLKIIHFKAEEGVAC